ncbi:MAG: Unknown protein, partial [uncultured Sulfurovum sp.]
NDFSDNDASLLQVLQLLNKEASHEDKLVIANDVGHIEAMKCIGATEREIKCIRQEERVIAGVSQEDEVKALEEIKTVEVQNGVHIIKTSLNSFSPIVDNYDKRPLLVYSKESLTYYGDITFLKEKYNKQIEKNEAYHGRGYFGFDGEYLKGCPFQKIVEDIIQSHFVSYHSFMFPFSFDKNTEKNNLKDRINVDSSFNETLESSGWQYKHFKLSEVNDTRVYNEYSYYLKPVRETLYNLNKSFKSGETSYYYTKKFEVATYSIDILNKKKYILKLTDVYLRLFETGIGILVLEMENYDHRELQDILNINEFGRRVYPQFLDNLCSNYSQKTKETFLANYIDVNLGEESFSEDFNYGKRIPNEIEVGKHILGVLGKTFVEKYTIKPILDDRMFLVCYSENESLMSSLQQSGETYMENEDWYRYLFVDAGAKTVQNSQMQKELTSLSTYPRWLGFGTLWGVTRYSFMALSTSGGRGLILPHTQFIYHQMAILILALQASLARFSNEISTLSNLDLEDNELEERVQELYEYYIKFVNRLHFRVLTHQDQGIELYEIARKISKFDKEIKDLDEEISELHTYIEMKAERRRNQRLERISELGAIFLPPTLLASIYGSNIFDFNTSAFSMIIGLVSILIVATLGFGVIKFKSKVVKGLLGFSLIGVMGGSVSVIGQKVENSQKHLEVKKVIKEEKQ